jgi:small-conductance mechanosensitive channel
MNMHLVLLAMLPMLAASGSLRSDQHGSSTMTVADGHQEDPKVDFSAFKSDEKPEKQGSPLKDNQFTWGYWKPMLLAMGFLLIMSDVAGPLTDLCCLSGLVKDSTIFLLTMLGYATIVFLVLDWEAAGMMTLVASSTLGAAFAILFVAFSFSIVAFSKDPRDPMKLILTDLAGLLRGLVRVIMLVTIMDIISTVAGVDWARLMATFAFLILALALALAGVIGDLIAHIFHRFDQHFHEGDFILFDGDLVQIKECKWRTTVGLSVPTQAVIYIPNNALCSTLINRTTDVKKEVVLMGEELTKLKLDEA